MTGENLVDIETAALEAEAAAIELPGQPPADQAAPSAAPVDQGAALEPTLEDLQRGAQNFIAGAEFLVNALSDGIAPNWAVTIDERRQLAGSVAMALAAWFPDERIPVKWLVLLQVAGSAWAIVTARRDPGSGKIMALRLPKPAATSAAQPAASSPAGNAAAGSGFTTAT